jgi:hypothetical protein
MHNSPIGSWARKGGSLGRILIQVLHGEDSVQVQVEEFTDALDQRAVVCRVDGNVVAGVVTNPEKKIRN